jgi:hypothetical protein
MKGKVNKTGTLAAYITGITEYKNRNRYYICYLVDIITGETVEENKEIQLSNYNAGNFGISQKNIYNDKILRDKLQRDWSHIRERIRKRKSYRDVENKFANFKDFYDFFDKYLDENFLLYAPFTNKRLQIDKDLKSYLRFEGSKKEYSPETITLLSCQDNNAVRGIINRNIPIEEKKNLLLRILERYER